jgi:glycosyltransferase involved in cell wall biosynthesis
VAENDPKIVATFNICIITVPFVNPIGVSFLSNFIDMIEPISHKLFVITGKFPDRPNTKIQIIRITGDEKKEIFLIRMAKYFIKQLRICFALLKLSKKIEIVIFYIGTQKDIFPALCARLMRKKIIWVVTGLASEVEKKSSTFLLGKSILPLVYKAIENINFHLADQLVLEPGNAMVQLGLNKFKNKIAFNYHSYIDSNQFKQMKKYDDRKNIIGYIGRLSPEKGVQDFVKAIPLILKKRSDLNFLIGGNGALYDRIKDEMRILNLIDKVNLVGWISHEDLPKYLNDLKLIALPSYTEGGVPAIIKEAMACGTLTLVTPIASSNIIKNGETGFVTIDHSPDMIAETAIKALDYPFIDDVINNALKLAKAYSFENVVQKYRHIISGVLIT